MRILFIASGFNSLSQRLYVELMRRGHEVSVELDVDDAVSQEAVELYAPDLILAPFLKRAIPESIFSRHVCLVVHPGIPGDRGPAALDWAILNEEPHWGVTVLQAEAEMDAGPVWAAAKFPMRKASKSSLYRNEVTEAALKAVLTALKRFEKGEGPPPADKVWSGDRGIERPPCKQADRAIDWQRDPLSRCLVCNEGLRPADAPALAEVPKGVTPPIRTCPSCRRLYWAGGHEARIRRTLAALATVPKPR